MSVKLRCETTADARAIEAVTASAFLNAPHATHTERYIAAALRRAGKLTVSLVAETDGTVIGHVAISPVSISDGATGWFGLGPIAIVPQHQRRGIGSRLVRAALRRVRASGADGCVVLGEPQYYRRFGFQAQPTLVLPGVPAEYFLALSFDASQPRGTVTYHEAFKAQA